jgi:hypothetical protein
MRERLEHHEFARRSGPDTTTEGATRV